MLRLGVVELREDVATELGVLVLRFERCFVGGTLRGVCHDSCHLLRDGGELGLSRQLLCGEGFWWIGVQCSKSGYFLNSRAALTPRKTIPFVFLGAT